MTMQKQRHRSAVQFLHSCAVTALLISAFVFATQRLELLQNQTKVKYNLNGAAGLTVNITLHPLGNRSITVLSVKVEICPIPAETENCPNPTTDMQVPHLKIENEGEETPTSPWQFVTGSQNNYTLPKNKTSEKLTAYIYCTNEPKIEELSFYGMNVGNVTLKIYAPNGSQIVVMENPSRLPIDGWTYIWFDELGEQDGDKVEIIIQKEDPDAPTVTKGLNIVACYEPEVMCAKEFVVDAINILTNHTLNEQGTFEEYMDNPHTQPLDLQLYNNGEPVTVDVFLTEPGMPSVRFYNVKISVTEAKHVTLSLMFNNGSVAATRKNYIDPQQHTMFDSFYGELGDFIRAIIVPRNGTNITAHTFNNLKAIIVDACTVKPPDYCQLRTRFESVTVDDCTSTEIVNYTYCQGSCMPSSYEPVFVLSESVQDETLLSEKNCKCCTGNPKPEKTPVPMTCTGGVEKIYYVQEYTSCECDICPVRPGTVPSTLTTSTSAPTTQPATTHAPALVNEVSF